MPNKTFYCLLLAGLLTLNGRTGLADDSNDSGFPTLTAHGFLDLRYQYSAAQAGETASGLGKFRDGGNYDQLRLNAAALSLHSRLSWDWSAHATAYLRPNESHPLGVTEAWLHYRPASESSWQFSNRLGLFFPPFSFENSGTAWTSPYTLSSSAINSWLGEELRSIGDEAQIVYRLADGDRMGVFGALLANNDSAGALLAWRGWSLQDYQATLGERSRLPNDIGISQNFPLQAASSRPFVEVDGKVGYYLGLSAERQNLYQLRVAYFDNRGQPNVLENGQYAWHTQFWSAGLHLDLPWQMTLISQGLTGRTRMGEITLDKRAVDMNYAAASVLLSKTWDIHRLSVRYDRFNTQDNDAIASDLNSESGHAWTANYNLTLAQRHQINLEMNYIDSNRAARAYLGQSTEQQEMLWQIAYRLFF